MVDPESIILNECRNNIPCVHLYYSDETDVWQAFGTSAYILEQIVTGNGISHITNYSPRMMMPSVTLSTSSFRRIAAIYDNIEKGLESHVILHPSIPIHREEYLLWAKILRKTK